MIMALAEWIEILSSVLLFMLVFGMSATVEIHDLVHQLKNVKAIGTGLFLQFVIMPLTGFMCVKAFNLDHPTGVALLVVTSSPGGSYSNWWCSMFNADLALSVTMTAISTLLSTVMLPINLLLYTRHSYNDDVVDSLDWGSLISAIAIVIVAIAMGLLCSAKYGSHFKLMANRIGNIAGVFLVMCSFIMSNSSKNARVWNREATFYWGVALPCLVGLILANCLTTALSLWKPERVAVSVECCYQNVGIATSVALSMFQGGDLAEAVAVPFYYGIVECILLFTYCIGAWKAGWTKAPANVNFWIMLITTYELVNTDEDGVVLGGEAMRPSERTVDDDYYYVEHDKAMSKAPPNVI